MRGRAQRVAARDCRWPGSPHPAVARQDPAPRPRHAQHALERGARHPVGNARQHGHVPVEKAQQVRFVRERRAVVRRAHLAHAPQRQPAIGGDGARQQSAAPQRHDVEGPGQMRDLRPPARPRFLRARRRAWDARTPGIGRRKPRRTGETRHRPTQSAKVDCGVEKVSCNSSSTGPRPSAGQSGASQSPSGPHCASWFGRRSCSQRAAIASAPVPVTGWAGHISTRSVRRVAPCAAIVRGKTASVVIARAQGSTKLEAPVSSVCSSAYATPLRRGTMTRGCAATALRERKPEACPAGRASMLSVSCAASMTSAPAAASANGRSCVARRARRRRRAA